MVLSNWRLCHAKSGEGEVGQPAPLHNDCGDDDVEDGDDDDDHDDDVEEDDENTDNDSGVDDDDDDFSDDSYECYSGDRNHLLYKCFWIPINVVPYYRIHFIECAGTNNYVKYIFGGEEGVSLHTLTK